MVKKTITYTDYDGNERTEDFYFNLNQVELAELQFEQQGGLKAWLEKISNANDNVEIMKEFKRILLRAYGEKSPDGRRLMKSEEISKAFTETEAYNTLFIQFIEGGDKAMADFIRGLLPADLSSKITDEVIEKAKEGKVTSLT